MQCEEFLGARRCYVRFARVGACVKGSFSLRSWLSHDQNEKEGARCKGMCPARTGRSGSRGGASVSWRTGWGRRMRRCASTAGGGGQWGGEGGGGAGLR